MDRIKRYIECYIPIESCNLCCHYCYITQDRSFHSKLTPLTHSPEEIRTALSVKRLGGICLINLCAGGETLLGEDILPVIRELLEEGHFISLVTNGTLTKRFEEIAEWPPELLTRLFIKFSFHFLEMKRLGWMDRFAGNVRLMKQRGVSFTVEVTPSDELIPYIDELKETCLRYFGALCHVTIARDVRTYDINVLSKLPFEEYKQVWGQFDSALFDFKNKIFYRKRKEFCYAGDWCVALNLETGRLQQCYFEKGIDNIYRGPEKPIHFEAVGRFCSLPHCYNGHAFLAFGVIPEVNAPTYAEERNRVCPDGSEWLRPEMKAFMSTRLSESNDEYNQQQKAIVCLKQLFGVRPLVKKAYRKTVLEIKSRKRK